MFSLKFAAFAALVSTVSVNALANDGLSLSGTPTTSIVAAHYYAFQPSVVDASGAKVTFSITNKPSWASFDSTSGRLYGTPLPQGNVAMYSNIEIHATTGAAHAHLAPFTITVQPLASKPPVISGTPATTVVEGQPYTFQPTATDPNGLRIVFSVTNLPSWATFNSTTGQISGTPAAGNVGTYANIVVTAYDGYFKGTLPAFNIVVQGPANTAPPPVSNDAAATLNWTPPTVNTDGSALTDLAGYKIYYGTTSALGQSVTVANAGLTRYVVSGLTAQATYYFAMTAYDSAGHESAQTQVASAVAQ